MYVHIFYEREEGGKKKTDGAMVALRHSCLSGFSYLKDLFKYFKKHHTVCEQLVGDIVQTC